MKRRKQERNRSDVAHTLLRCPFYQLKGHKNKSWPIKSAFYCERGKNFFSLPNEIISRSSSALEASLMDELDEASVDDDQSRQSWSSDNVALLASGSADPYVYIYDVASGRLLQRLEGHKDRVYAVAFHPTQPTLASCSADFTIKVWAQH